MFNQLYIYLDKVFSKLQCIFRKGYNAQMFFMNMIENRVYALVL